MGRSGGGEIQHVQRSWGGCELSVSEDQKEAGVCQGRGMAGKKERMSAEVIARASGPVEDSREATGGFETRRWHDLTHAFKR